MASSITTSRLRKAFRYPSDEDSDEPSDLDEEHQEKLITDLQQQDARSNDIYRKAFLAIPLTGAVYSLYLLISATSAQQRLLALLSLTSLLCTAYILHFQPLQPPDRKGKKPLYKLAAEQGSPLERYLIPLNGGLVGLLQLAALLSWRRGQMEDAWRESLPALVFGLSMFVRWQLAPVDLEELKGARYELKGA